MWRSNDKKYREKEIIFELYSFHLLYLRQFQKKRYVDEWIKVKITHTREKKSLQTNYVSIDGKWIYPFSNNLLKKGKIVSSQSHFRSVRREVDVQFNWITHLVSFTTKKLHVLQLLSVDPMHFSINWQQFVLVAAAFKRKNYTTTRKIKGIKEKKNYLKYLWYIKKHLPNGNRNTVDAFVNVVHEKVNFWLNNLIFGLFDFVCQMCVLVMTVFLFLHYRFHELIVKTEKEMCYEHLSTVQRTHLNADFHLALDLYMLVRWIGLFHVFFPLCVAFFYIVYLQFSVTMR